MGLSDRINDEVKTAMRAKDRFRTQTLRMVTAAIKQFEVDKRETPSEEQVFAILEKAAKQRRESIEAAIKADRQEMAANEQAELDIILEFMPSQLSEEELAGIIDEIISDLGVTSRKDQGKVMGALMPKIKGRADGRLAGKLVGDRLE